MARFALVLVASAITVCVGQITAQDMDKGIEMGTRTMQGVCWYEYLKIKPDKNPKTKNFGDCYVNLSLNRTIGSFESQGVSRTNYAAIKSNLGGNFNPFVKTFAPIQYSACSEYIDDPEKAFDQDYSAVLNDGSGSYPFRGWAHCLMGQMEKAHGKESLNAMREKLNAPHPWINEVYNRENENRARHSAPPVKLNKELTARAQKWADGLAERCAELKEEDHIKKENPEATYEGKLTGENIAMNNANAPPEDIALASANSWYEEIGDYPWPAYKGKGNDDTFGKIGHFTASVWKGVQQVGYGLGRREGCDKTYVVGRYWPSGNMVGEFAENVGPLVE